MSESLGQAILDKVDTAKEIAVDLGRGLGGAALRGSSLYRVVELSEICRKADEEDRRGA